jgi:hypothetical protein
VALPKKPNYGFEKRRKEMDRQKKKDAKQQAKRERAGESGPDTQPRPENDPGGSQSDGSR